MSVTDQQPTRVGQRVQEIFSDSRGWVTYLNENGEASIDWDEPSEHDGDVFPISALRVVEVIRIDADLYEDPSTWFFIEQISNGTEHGPVYTLRNGVKLRGVEQLRQFMLGFHKSA
ncbi:hypothetical protein SEA_GALACTICA_76 [Streptomyces phage Galactica]|nr:hypothetical protein SEA_GALACTICA_76 [Streptomyces phage Galactica]